MYESKAFIFIYTNKFKRSQTKQTMKLISPLVFSKAIKVIGAYAFT